MARYRPPKGPADRTARAVGLARLFVAALTFAALAAQLALGRRRESFDVVNFFSFFTVESNALAVLIFTITGVTALRAGLQPERFVALRGATTLYMTITGVIYVLLHRGLEGRNPRRHPRPAGAQLPKGPRSGCSGVVSSV